MDVSHMGNGIGLKEGKTKKLSGTSLWLCLEWQNEPSWGILIQIPIILSKLITVKEMEAKEKGEFHCQE